MLSVRAFDEIAGVVGKRPTVKQSVLLIFYHCKATGANDASVSELDALFSKLHLGRLQRRRATRELSSSRDVSNGRRPGSFRLSPEAHRRLSRLYAKYFEPPGANSGTPADDVDLAKTPLLGEEEIFAAGEMAKLYVIIHCYENSVRKLIERVLSKRLGDRWWDTAVTKPEILDRVKSRQEKEQRQKWITPRGASPLYYTEWDDLLYLIKKYEKEFAAEMLDFEFVQPRLRELARYRNIVAHNGAIPMEENFQRVALSFKEWCRQISS